MTADMISLRLNRKGNTKGLTGQHIDVFHVNQTDKVVAYRRSYDGGPSDDCVVVVNFSINHFDKYEIGLPSGGEWKVRFSSNREKYSEDFDGGSLSTVTASDRRHDSQPFCGEIFLPPYTVVVYSQEK